MVGEAGVRGDTYGLSIYYSLSRQPMNSPGRVVVEVERALLARGREVKKKTRFARKNSGCPNDNLAGMP